MMLCVASLLSSSLELSGGISPGLAELLSSRPPATSSVSCARPTLPARVLCFKGVRATEPLAVSAGSRDPDDPRGDLTGETGARAAATGLS